MNNNLSFLNKYNNSKNIRFTSFHKALSIADSRNLKTFVECGTARGKKKFFFINNLNWKDGMSTIIFSDFVKYKKGKLYSCDLSKKNIKSSIKFTKDFSNYIYFVVSDSVIFLKNLEFKIDFLYLDSLDAHDKNIASLHQLNEIKSAITKLNKNSLVLLDDKKNKGTLSINYMLENSFKILNETEEQVLLSY
tara:strand:- start:1065 stop:1640 length:576 start_codon:yes stop_codon:yes gene_type:complete